VALRPISMPRRRLSALELLHGVEGKVAEEMGARAWTRGKYGGKRGDGAVAGGFSSGSVARGRERKRGGGPAGAGAWKRRMREVGGGRGAAVSSMGRSAMAPDGRAREVALSRKQGRGWARATRCGRLTRGTEGDEGPGVSGGVQEREREREAGRRRGTDRWAWATLCRGGGSNGILN
jgi:hypothetical protein